MEEISFFCNYRVFCFVLGFLFFDGWMFKSKVASMKGGEACVALSFIFIIRHFQSALFLWEMSLSFVEDELSSASPRGPCLLVGPTQGWKTTTAEKNKCECPNVLITWAHALIYMANTHMVLYVRVCLKLI